MRWRRGLAWAAVLAAAAAVVSQAEPLAGFPVGGYAAAFLAIGAAAMASPAVVLAVNRATAESLAPASGEPAGGP